MNNLPQEIIVDLFKLMDYHSIAAFILISRRIYFIVKPLLESARKLYLKTDYIMVKGVEVGYQSYPNGFVHKLAFKFMGTNDKLAVDINDDNIFAWRSCNFISRAPKQIVIRTFGVLYVIINKQFHTIFNETIIYVYFRYSGKYFLRAEFWNCITFNKVIISKYLLKKYQLELIDCVLDNCYKPIRIDTLLIASRAQYNNKTSIWSNNSSTEVEHSPYDIGVSRFAAITGLCAEEIHKAIVSAASTPNIENTYWYDASTKRFIDLREALELEYSGAKLFLGRN